MSDAPTLLPPGAALPALPPEAPSRRYTFSKPLGWLVLKVLGWRYVGGFPNAPRQVLVGWPHTSNWDGIIGLAAAAVCGVDVKFFAKRPLFRPPLGWLLRSFGGIPVVRTRASGMVEAAVERFELAAEAGDGFVLGLTPEGTRSPSEGWKTGFHRIAVRAGVPISVLVFDHGRKQIGIVGAVVPTGDLHADLAAIEGLLEGVRGRHPERETPPLAPAVLAPPASGGALPPARGSFINAASGAEPAAQGSNARSREAR